MKRAALKPTASVGVVLALAAGLSAALPAVMASAQEYLAMSSRQNYQVAPEQRPHVAVAKRPDYFVRSALLICDTRDREQRTRELEETMRALLAAAADNPQIETAVLRQTGEDAFAIPLEEFELFQRFVAPGSRPDSSEVRFLVKTPISESDDLDSVDARLEAFRTAAAMSGRTELLFQGSPELSLVDPRQYRMDVVRAIAEDARAITEAMGEGYAVQVTGLERELAWRRSGDLELQLFIPHAIEIAPRP